MSVDSSGFISRSKRDSSAFQGPFTIAVWVSIIIILLLSLLDLIGWIFGITVLKSIFPDWEPMKIITAICLNFTGISLLSIRFVKSSTLNKTFPRILATFISIVSLLTIYIYTSLIATGNESSLTAISFLKFFLASDSRMALLSACTLLLVSCVIFLLSVNNKRASDIAHILIMPALLISYYIPVSYLLGVTTATEIMNVSVAMSTGIAFCCICVAILLMKPDTWFLNVLTSSESGGVISRRLLPPLMSLPIVIGWLRIEGERAGLFKSEEGIILVASAYFVSFLILVWLTARYMNRIDREKNIYNKALQESEERFKAMAEASPVGMGVVKTPGGIFLYLNPSYEQFCGYDTGELLGKESAEIFWDPRDRDLISKKLIEDSYISNFEVRIKRKDGSSFWTLSSIKPIFFNGQPAFLGTFIDISKRKAAEESLRLSEQKLKYHFENSPLAVVEWDKEYIVTQWSLEAESIFGWKLGEVIGKSLMDLNMIYEDDTPIVNRTIERLNSGKENIVVSSNRNYTKSGNVIECVWYNSVLMDDNSQMSSVMSLIQDITIVKKTERELIESKERYEELVTNAKSIIMKQDTNGIITFINEFGQEFFGFREEELIGKTALENILPETESTGRKLDKMVESIYEDPDKYSININENIKKNGERVWIEWHNKALFDKKGNRTGHMAIGVDITERKKAETKLKESQTQLIELIATKDKFFNIVAHDLKNPFTSLLGSTELLFGNIQKMDNEEIKELALILYDSAKGGYAILQNLLDWSRSQTGQIDYKPEQINLNVAIEENISNLLLPAATKEIDLYNETDESIFLLSDKNMLNTILRNLLSNAIKYTNKGGKVKVKAIVDTVEVLVSVSDTGTGISQEKIKKLFRIDSKLSTPGTANEQGTGLGLKLCHEFAEKLGGRIWVESIENEGSEFKLSIPVK